MEQTHALGRRKAAVARVYLTEGEGNVVINGRPLEDYFKEETLRYIVLQAYTVTETLGKFDTKVTLVGGGTKGQAEAVRLGIARALCEIDKEAYRSALKAAGLLTRDAREVERKKPGRPGARKRFQFSKR
ncbi:MAG: 30S ribosomal protein S9 [Candidatus Cryptobacteroides sp.]